MNDKNGTSFEEIISNIIDDKLATKIFLPIPVFANRTEAAKVLGVSVQKFDRAFVEGRLRDDKHSAKFADGGSRMYFLPEIIKDLMPPKATILIFGKVDADGKPRL